MDILLLESAPPPVFELSELLPVPLGAIPLGADPAVPLGKVPVGTVPLEGFAPLEENDPDETVTWIAEESVVASTLGDEVLVVKVVEDLELKLVLRLEDGTALYSDSEVKL